MSRASTSSRDAGPPDPPGPPGPDVRALATFDAFLLAVVVLASRANMFVHEVFGHAVPAAAVGAKVTGVDLTLLGGGQAHFFLPASLGALGRATCFAGGSLINVVTGAAALFLAPRIKSVRAAMFLVAFGTASVVGSFTYTAKGLYYGIGDAARVTGALSGANAELDLGLGNSKLWIAVTLAVPIVSAVALRLYFPLQDRFFPPRTWLHRIRTTALTLGIVAVAYGGLLVAADRFVAPQDPARLATQWDDARMHAAREARSAAILAELRARRPGVPDDVLVKDLLEEVRRNPIAPSAVPKTIPLGWILPLLVVLGTVWAATRRPRDRGPPPLRIDASTLAYTAAAAGMVLLVLFMLGQRLPLTWNAAS